MKASEAGQLVMFILAAYPSQRQRMSREDSDAMCAAYAAALADVPYQAAHDATVRVLRTAKFIPTIAEIRDAIGIVTNGAGRIGLDAWGDVQRMRTFRERDAMADFDPLVLEICRNFGWIEWRTLWRGVEIEQWHVVTSENDAADRARFAEAYNARVASARREAQASAGAGAKALPAANGGPYLVEGKPFDPDTLVQSLTAKLTGGPK